MQYTYDECNRLTLQKAVDKDDNVVEQYHYNERGSLTASADACVSLTMGLISIQEGYSEGAVIYGVLAILSFAQVCSAYNMIYSVEVIGSKGSIRAKLDKANSSKLVVEW